MLLTLHLVFTDTTWKKNNTLNMMPAEPGALIKHMRTQICTFCQSGGGFPTETRGWVSQNLNLKYSAISCLNRQRNSFLSVTAEDINDSLQTKSILFWETWLCFKLFLCPLRHIIVFSVLAAAAITVGVSV